MVSVSSSFAQINTEIIVSNPEHSSEIAYNIIYHNKQKAQKPEKHTQLTSNVFLLIAIKSL